MTWLTIPVLPGRSGSGGTLAVMADVPGAIATARTRPSRRPGGPGAARMGFAAVGWVIVAVLGLIALLRLVAWDSAEPLIVLNALSLIIYLPAWVVAVAALVKIGRASGRERV